MVYVLTNETMPGLIKIGLTTRPIAERLAELRGASGVPGRFVVEALFEASDPAALERAVHEALADTRYSNDREFFRGSPAAGIAAVREHAGHPPIYVRTPESQPGPQVPTGRMRHAARRESPELRCRECGYPDNVILADYETHWRCGRCRTLQSIRPPAEGDVS